MNMLLIHLFASMKLEKGHKKDYLVLVLKLCYHYDTRVAQKVMSHIFFSGNYLFRMYEIQAQYNWMLYLHMLFFHIISMYAYGLTSA